VNIAIDGPSGAGKSTLARKLAARLGYVYVDTGALYRAIAYDCITHHAETEEQIIARLPEVKVSLDYIDGVQHVFVGGEDVSGCIRTAEVSMAASKVAAIPKVREFLFNLQQEMAKTHSVVMDGRDIGTVVFPHAELKIFVTASAEVRAQRRYDELRQKGMEADYADILKNVQEREYIDSHREVSPLRQADDALLLDNSEMTIAQQKEWLLEQFRKATL
jgi:cytidylate kinase